MSDQNESYFSVSFDLIIVGRPLPYDLYVNSSLRESVEKYVRVYPKGERLSSEDISSFKLKYSRLYVPETQRTAYLDSLVRAKNVSDEVKTNIIKDTALGHLDKIFDSKKEFNTEVLGEAIKGCKESIEYMVDVVQDYNVSEVQDLIGDLSFHDFYTYEHSINVSMYCISMFKTYKKTATREELLNAGLGGLLHDLGKIKIPTNILNNADKLSDADWKLINTHPVLGGELLDEKMEHMVDFNLSSIKRVVMEHHENVDGTGYPNKLKGDEIHLLSKITAIADFFDAVTTKRSYHEPMNIDQALQIMQKTVGKKIDAKLFEILLRNVKKVVKNADNIRYKLPDNFDGGQPYNKLPFIEEKKQLLQTNFFAKEEVPKKKEKKKVPVSKKKNVA